MGRPIGLVSPLKTQTPPHPNPLLAFHGPCLKLPGLWGIVTINCEGDSGAITHSSSSSLLHRPPLDPQTLAMESLPSSTSASPERSPTCERAASAPQSPLPVLVNPPEWSNDWRRSPITRHDLGELVKVGWLPIHRKLFWQVPLRDDSIPQPPCPEPCGAYHLHPPGIAPPIEHLYPGNPDPLRATVASSDPEWSAAPVLLRDPL